ncbi:MAG: FAD-dependent oxidoreductase [Actinobacteria bacterium]|nr:FAD-dependent oxidoreductase [Actinomycetota bacterium]
MARVVVIGGGWAGAGAALAARMAGADVTLLERTDMLLGTGLVGGIMRNNGRFTATEEHIAMGMGRLWGTIDANLRHRNVAFPGHNHADLYDVSITEPAIRALLEGEGIDVRTQARVTDAVRSGDTLAAVKLGDELVEADVFVETTGSAGPQNNCTKYGNGCAMCALRCPTFGGRVSVAAKAGIEELRATRMDGSVGVMSGSCKLHTDSVSPELRRRLAETGVAVVPLPDELKVGGAKAELLGTKACQQYALPAFAENVVLLDTGHVKLMSPFFPLAQLRTVPGLENARFEDPYSGGVGNSIRYLSMTPRSDALQADGLSNLFVGGEKTGPLVGHTEAIVSGSLAGANAVRWAAGRELVTLPRSLACGDIIASAGEVLRDGDLSQKLTFSGASFFERMKAADLYTTDAQTVRDRVAAAGLTDVFRSSSK